MNEGGRVTWRTLAGLFLISLATIMDEILLTRIFSVTMWYHFAFGAISLAMFSMTVGALQVYQRPEIYDRPRETGDGTQLLVVRHHGPLEVY